MEEKILEILNKTLYYMDHDRRRTAKEITVHVMGFIEWLGIMQNEIWWNKFHNRWDWISSSETTENITQYTTNQIYQFWLTNIKDSNKM